MDNNKCKCFLENQLDFPPTPPTPQWEDLKLTELSLGGWD